MLNGGKPFRDEDGKVIEEAALEKGAEGTKPGRVQRDGWWFGNIWVISQTAFDHYRTSSTTKKDDPYSVLLRRNKLPVPLSDVAANPNTRKHSEIFEIKPFPDMFGPKAQRKCPRVGIGSFAELADAASEAAAVPEEGLLAAPVKFLEPQMHADFYEPIYAKGTSRRIYGELYKAIDFSDVILHVLDARDALGTMCESILECIKEKAHEQVVLVVNKCDLAPNWVTARYIQHLPPRYPIIAFHAFPNHSFGKGTLIQPLRQFSQLHVHKKQISVGFFGYPNVGTSSVMNTLKSGKVCRVALVPGETKVWQYITLPKRIYLIDCPGVVPTVPKTVMRVEALRMPSDRAERAGDEATSAKGSGGARGW